MLCELEVSTVDVSSRLPQGPRAGGLAGGLQQPAGCRAGVAAHHFTKPLRPDQPQHSQQSRQGKPQNH